LAVTVSVLMADLNFTLECKAKTPYIQALRLRPSVRTGAA
jgi:hypothetical protein